MAFLDFMKERAQGQQPVAQTSQEQKPETAKQMYSREGAQEQATQKPVERMPEPAKQEAVDAARPAAKLMEQATSHESKTQDAPGGHADGKEALMHNQSGQEKSQEAMSPTDSHRGHRQERSRGMER
jgi:hypothetical protein